MFKQQIKNVVPFVEDKLFESFEVVPSIFEEDYCAKISEKSYFEAMAFLTSISHRQFVRLHKDGQLYRDERLKQWFIKCRYDKDRGLLLDEIGENIL